MALIFPSNSQTKTFEITNVGTRSVEIASPSIVLAVHSQQSGTQSNTMLKCGNDIIAKNYDKDYPLDLLFYKCNNVLWLDKTGSGDSSFTTITYVVGDPALDTTSVSVDLSGSTFPTVSGGFTYGEIVISFFLFAMLAGSIFSVLLKRHLGNKVKKDYINYD